MLAIIFFQSHIRKRNQITIKFHTHLVFSTKKIKPKISICFSKLRTILKEPASKREISRMFRFKKFNSSEFPLRGVTFKYGLTLIIRNGSDRQKRSSNRSIRVIHSHLFIPLPSKYFYNQI